MRTNTWWALLGLAAVTLPGTAAAQTPEEHIAVVGTGGGPPTVLSSGTVGAGPAALGWTADGAAVLSAEARAGRRGVVVRYSADGRATTVLERLSEVPTIAAFSRDGRLAAGLWHSRDVVLRGAGRPARVRARRGEWPSAVAWASDGRHAAIAFERPRRGDSNIVVADGASGRVVRRIRVRGDADSLAWAPDGRRLAYAAGEVVAKVVVLDTVTGARRRVAAPNAQQSGGAPAFSPTTGRLAYLGYGRIFIAGGSDRIELRCAVVHGLAWAPDGQSLAVGLLGGDLRPALGFFDVVDRRREPRILARPLAQAVEHISWSPDGTRIAYAATWPG